MSWLDYVPDWFAWLGLSLGAVYFAVVLGTELVCWYLAAHSAYQRRRLRKSNEATLKALRGEDW